ncbi:ABC transporter permease [Pseudonocardia kunmingensis]|uniref:Autoinducer 2 import system permease protein LsrC n=1 Tax=Pseudonocardia kunmingensis TaxID=630975 RepID=A0A543DRC9_9PSEU|nr:ABC transporter permease [Pseudonocardia kunmingensis]TQM11896.1 monosaccharide ABC transporter membrane protein (CUT2 family) [Pseudonocardia kunmingensis]
MSAMTLSRPPRLDSLRSYSTVLGMIVVVVAVAVARPLFVDPRNLAAVAVDATVLVVLAVGLSVLMSMKGLDLSIAATADLAGYLAARALLEGHGTPAAVLIAIGVGVAVGVVNGVLAGYLGVPAIVATLGLNLVLTAVALVVSDNGTPQQLFTAPIDLVKPVLVFGSDSWGPFRLLLLAGAVVVVVAWFATTRTTWGRRIELVDAGARAAELAGTPVRATFASGFVLCGLLAGVGGLMLTARTGLAVPGSAQPFLLDAFTAVYLGATASPRGRISVLWTVLGAVFVTLLANGLVLLGLGAPWRYGLNGALILLALALGVLRRRGTR